MSNSFAWSMNLLISLVYDSMSITCPHAIPMKIHVFVKLWEEEHEHRSWPLTLPAALSTRSLKQHRDRSNKATHTFAWFRPTFYRMPTRELCVCVCCWVEGSRQRHGHTCMHVWLRGWMPACWNAWNYFGMHAWFNTWLQKWVNKRSVNEQTYEPK